jgi:nitrogen fixation protein NifZ
MTEPVVPKFQWGQRVQALLDLFNDGSFPDFPAEELLVKQGDAGEIVNVGTHVDSNTPVYMVEFAPGRVVGCMEQEITPV